MNKTEIQAFYQENEQTYAAEKNRLQQRITRLAYLRLLVFIGGILLGILTFRWNIAAGSAVSLFSAVLFFRLVFLTLHLGKRRDHVAGLEQMNREELQALSGDYSFPDNGKAYGADDHPYTADLDIFGERSVFQYINRTCLLSGQDQLAESFRSPVMDPQVIRGRQKAVSVLREKTSWRQDFLASGRRLTEKKNDIKRFNSWLSKDYPYLSSPGFRLVRILFPALTLLSLLALFAGLLPESVLILFFLLQLGITGFKLRDLNRMHQNVSRQQAYLQTYADLIQYIEREDFSSEVCQHLKQRLISPLQASVELKKLEKIVKVFDYRLNMVTGFILNGLLLWDFQCAVRLSKWKRTAGSCFPAWYQALGEMDALLSLATYSFNHPRAVFPELSSESYLLKGKNIRHPIIPDHLCVGNDFEISSRGNLFIITGANMSGKSTFLRTLAVNVILAEMGAPVCADEFSLIPVQVFTSMRTADSLPDNESYFYAELKRLRQLKDAVSEGADLLFFLDEILKGTNSEDKSWGSRLFMEELLKYQATGFIATHDTSLAELAGIHPERVHNYCFEIDIQEGRVRFDYLIREGVTTKMNAALLMQQMGIVPADNE